MSFSVALLLVSFIFFLMGYAYFKDKAKTLLYYNFFGKKVKKEYQHKYRKLQGLHSLINGTMFLLVYLSIYFVNKFEMEPKWLYLWFVAFFVGIIFEARIAKRYLY